jgi:serine/threonine-protein kinase
VGELEPGSKVAGKYTLIERVGRGGMGDVWIAKNESTAAEVAIKTLRSDRKALDGAADRFRQEARVSAKLAHPNVARVYDLLEEQDGTLLLIMERLRGETLKKKLENGPMDEKEVVGICLPILEALGAAHEAGIIHRDVTPSNIFLAEEGGRITPKLIDFGVAKADETTITTKTGHALGTPQYMSPEQIRSGAVDPRSDLFSLSVTMFEAMTGANPFKRGSATSCLAAVLETDVDPDPRISPLVWLALARGLAKQSYERPDSAAEMASILRRAIGAEEVVLRSGASADLSGQLDVRPTVAKKRPWGLFAAIAGLAVIIGLAAMTLGRKERPTETAPAAPPPIVLPTQTALEPTATATVAAIVTPVESASAAKVKVTAPGKPQASTRPKTVATTPGF